MKETRVKLWIDDEETAEVVGRGAICIVFQDNEEGEAENIVCAQSMIHGEIGITDIISHLKSMHNCFKREDGSNMLDEAITCYMMEVVLKKAGEKNGD